MKESFELKEVFKTSPDQIFEAWLDSEKHTNMTGGAAICSHNIGDSFSTWDGYITGKNIDIKHNEEIKQCWRTSEFKDTDDDSIVHIQLKKIDIGTEFIIHHSNIPEGQTQYMEGWKEHYFIPMSAYFEKTI